jgi:hypothetical protein
MHVVKPIIQDIWGSNSLGIRDTFLCIEAYSLLLAQENNIVIVRNTEDTVIVFTNTNVISIDKEPYFIVVSSQTSGLFSKSLPIWQI